MMNGLPQAAPPPRASTAAATANEPTIPNEICLRMPHLRSRNRADIESEGLRLERDDDFAVGATAGLQ